MIDKFIEVEAFENCTDLEDILGFVYGQRIYISDVLDEDFPEDILKATEKFLETDVEYDGDEREAWKRFLNSNIEELFV